ncbi:MAG: HNH endonuclease [Elusimicrobiota bacterium]
MNVNRIKERDDYKCQECYSMINTTVHHIFYKSRIHKDIMNEDWNLITLCHKHHQGVNGVHNGNKKLREKLEKIAIERLINSIKTEEQREYYLQKIINNKVKEALKK